MCTFLQVIFFWEGIRQNANIFAISEWKFLQVCAMINLLIKLLFYRKVHFLEKTEGVKLMAAIASVIKYEGDNSTFIWKHPCEDFNTSSQLIVHESQEAILFLNGQALDLFGPGRHTLETC